MQLNELKCKKCATSIKEEDFLDNMPVVKCSKCSTVFSVSETESGKKIDKKKRNPVPLPEKFETEFKKGNFVISFKKSQPVVIFFVFFTVFWNGFMIVWHTIAISTGMWIMSIFGSIHTGVGIWLIYHTLKTIFNKTTITVGSGFIDVKSMPFSLKGRKHFSSMDIEQVYCRQKFGNRKGTYYDVYVINKKNGRSMKLVSELPDYEQAAYIEYELETKLDIRDREVSGEVGK